jgi:hypothetical protein
MNERVTAELNQPLKITIPCPSRIPAGRGVNGTSRGAAGNIRVRMTDDERALIIAEAQAVGVTPMTFMRWTAVMVAAALEQYRLSGNTTEEVEVHDGATLRSVSTRSNRPMP